MEPITIRTKTNGYTAENIQSMISIFEKAAAILFPGCTIEHFYYGDKLDMADLLVRPGDYAHFNIYASSVRLNGYAGTDDDCRKYEKLTYNDELFEGKLMEIVEC